MFSLTLAWTLSALAVAILPLYADSSLGIGALVRSPSRKSVIPAAWSAAVGLLLVDGWNAFSSGVL